MRLAALILSGLLIAALLGAVAAHAPGRVKLIGLYSIALGLGTGGLLGRLARQQKLPAHWTTQLAIGLCVLVGQGTAAAEGYRLRVESLNEHFRSMPLSASIPDFTPQQIADMPEESRGVAEQIVKARQDREEMSSFGGWLRWRIDPVFAGWPATGYYIWWLSEMALATFAGAVIGAQQLRRGHPQDAPAVATSPQLK